MFFAIFDIQFTISFSGFSQFHFVTSTAVAGQFLNFIISSFSSLISLPFSTYDPIFSSKALFLDSSTNSLVQFGSFSRLFNFSSFQLS